MNIKNILVQHGIKPNNTIITKAYGCQKLYHNQDFITYIDSDTPDMQKIKEIINRDRLIACLYCIINDDNLLVDITLNHLSTISKLKIAIVCKNNKYIHIAKKYNCDYIVSIKGDYKAMIQTGLLYLQSSKWGQKKYVIVRSDTIVNLDVITQYLDTPTIFHLIGFQQMHYLDFSQKMVTNITTKFLMIHCFIISRLVLEKCKWALFEQEGNIDQILEKNTLQNSWSVKKLDGKNTFTFFYDKNSYITIKQDLTVSLNSIINIFSSHPKYIDKINIINSKQLPIIHQQENKIIIYDLRKPNQNEIIPLKNYIIPRIKIPNITVPKESKIDKFYFLKIYQNSDKRLHTLDNISKINHSIIETKGNRINGHIISIKDAIARKHQTISIIEDKIISNNLIRILVDSKFLPHDWNLIIIMQKSIRKIKLIRVNNQIDFNTKIYAYCLNYKIFDTCLNLLSSHKSSIDQIITSFKLQNTYFIQGDFDLGYNIINIPIKLLNYDAEIYTSNKKKQKEYTPIITHNKGINLIYQKPNNTSDQLNHKLQKNNNQLVKESNKKIVIQSMTTKTQLNLDEILCIMSFIKNGHEFHLYTYDSLENIPLNCIIKKGQDILPLSKSNFFEETFCLQLLYEKGGYWTNLDTICNRYLNFVEPYIFSTQKVDSIYDMINYKFMKVPSRSELTLWCLNEIKNNMSPLDTIYNGVKKYNLDRYIKPYHIFCPIDQITDIFTPSTLTIDSDTIEYCINLFKNEWPNYGIEPNKPHYGSLFYLLLNKYCKNYIIQDVFNLQNTYGKYNNSCVLFYWIPFDLNLVEETEKLIDQTNYNVEKYYVIKENSKGDKNRVQSFIENDIYINMFTKMLEFKLIDSLHIIFGIAKNDKYLYNNEPLFTDGNYYNYNDRIFLWKLNDLKSLLSFSYAKMYFYKGYGNYEHFYSIMAKISPHSIFIRYLATALPYTDNLTIDDDWIQTYARNNICKKYSNFKKYFAQDYCNYDFLLIDTKEKVKNYKKLFPNTKHFVKLDKYSLMNYNSDNYFRTYDLLFCASDVHPSKNWDVFTEFIDYCEKKKYKLNLLIVTPVILNKTMSKYTKLQYVKITIKRGLTSSEMEEIYNLSKCNLITFGRDANPRVISESLNCGCYNIILDILSDGQDIIKNNPLLGKIIEIPKHQKKYELSYKSISCVLGDAKCEEIYRTIIKKYDHCEISSIFTQYYSPLKVCRNIYENIENRVSRKNKMVVTLATEDYSNNLNYLLCSLVSTNPELMVLIYYVGWREKLVSDFKNIYPFYSFEEYTLDNYTKGDVIKLKVELQYLTYSKLKIPFIWIDADAIVLKPLDDLFAKINQYNLICYHRPYENDHMKFAVGVISFGLFNNAEEQKINEIFLEKYYQNSKITKGVNNWFYDQTSLYETFIEFKETIKLYELSENEHSIKDTIDTTIYSRRIINKQSLSEILRHKKIHIPEIDFSEIKLKYL